MKTWKNKAAALLCSAAILTAAAYPVPAAPSVMTVSAAAGDAAGWFESAYLTWAPVSGASGYNVYADGKQIDSMLIRQYSGYYRADALGLKAGSHTLKAVPVIGGKEDGSKATERTVTVTAFDRSGFGWVNGTSSGAYNEDGTLKSGAVVLYVTEQTKDSVSCDVVTSSKGDKTKVTGIQEILNAIKKGYDSRPYCIRVVGTVTDPNGISAMGGDLTIDGGGKFKGGMTLEGVGEDAVLHGFGVKVKNMSNLEIRNLGAMLCDSSEGDNFSLQQGNDHVWVHNCDSFYGMAGGDADQAKGDGALDCKLSTYVTFSYNHFWDNGKCNLLGLKENTTSDLYITYHHNWYDHSDSRHPRVRFYTAHVYNNYYDGNAKYGIGSTNSSSIFAESNYFRNCKYPMLISMQGSDVATGGTFSGEDGGVIKAYGNYMEGQKAFIAYSGSSDFDAYVVTNKSDKVPDSVKAKQTSKLGSSYSHSYNNFDTSNVMYSYKADAAKSVPELVKQYAGRQGGGDFSWQFTSADDSDSAVNQGLMSALKSYKSKIAAIGSGSYVGPTEPEQPDVTTAPAETQPGQQQTTQPVQQPPVPAGGYVHNFTENGLNSSFYAISGNLSTSKGTVNYGGKTLTQCLKMESATSVTFNAPSDGTLTLVFAEPTATVKFDGTKSASPGDGTIMLTVKAGSHTITKADSCNLFFMTMDLKVPVQPAETTTAAPVITTEPPVSTTTETEPEMTSSAPMPQLMPGDVDCSGDVNIADAVLLARYNAEDKAINVTDLGLLNAELDGERGLNGSDLAWLLEMIAGLR